MFDGIKLVASSFKMTKRNIHADIKKDMDSGVCQSLNYYNENTDREDREFKLINTCISPALTTLNANERTMDKCGGGNALVETPRMDCTV